MNTFPIHEHGQSVADPAGKPKPASSPRRKRQKRLNQDSLALWTDLATPAPVDHPALRDCTESIPRDARLIDLDGVSWHGDSMRGWLVLPLYNPAHTLTGLAFLPPDGRTTRYMPENWPTGAWLANHDQPSGGNLLACVDLADGAALSALNLPVMACLTDSNLCNSVRQWQAAGNTITVICTADQTARYLDLLAGTGAGIQPLILSPSGYRLDEMDELADLITCPDTLTHASSDLTEAQASVIRLAALPDADCEQHLTEAAARLAIPRNDLKRLVREQQQKARPVLMEAPERSGRLAMPVMEGNSYYDLLPSGLYFVEVDKEGAERMHRLSDPIQVMAMTRDLEGGAWGRLLQWYDPDKRLHQWAMPAELFKGSGEELRGILLNGGLAISPNGRDRQWFASYLQRYQPSTRLTCTNRLGWHGDQYVLPNEQIDLSGDTPDQVVYQNGGGVQPAFAQSGTLAQWQQQISRYAQGNSRLLFALSVAFAGPLMALVNEQSGGFHYRGNSSSGKSTALEMACTVWGNPARYKRSWRMTGNGLEAIANLHNDGFLPLDELKEANPKTVGDTVYMLGNEQGKTRMTRDLTARPAATWRVMILSTGEESLASVMQQAGQQARAGQEVRLADIAVDAGRDMGAWEKLHDSLAPATFSEKLQSAGQRQYGTAGRAWLDHLTGQREALLLDLPARISTFMATHVPAEAAGQVQRVGRRFALVAIAGELATQAGITGWLVGEAIAASARCFNDWLTGFGGMGNRENQTMLEQVQAFIELHGSSRFESLLPDLGKPRERIHNRAGYFRYEQDETEYLIFPQVFRKEVCKGYDPQAVARVLKAEGCLKCEPGRYTHKARTPESKGPTSFYIIRNRIFSRESISHGNSENTPEPVTSKSDPVPAVPAGKNGNGNSSSPCGDGIVPVVPVVPAVPAVPVEKQVTLGDKDKARLRL